MDLTSLQTLLARLAGARILCVGDVMVDRFVEGEVARISPEAPIPVLTRSGEQTMLGGAGNVARNIASLGASAALVGLIGDDPVGREADDLLREEPGLENRLVTSRDRRTTLKTRFTAAGQQLLRVDQEDRGLPQGRDVEALAREIGLAAEGAGAVLLSDYAKGVAATAVLEACHEASRQRGIPIIVDPKGRDFARYGPVDLIKPNALELAGATGLPTETDAEVDAALEAALAGSSAKAIAVTRGARGLSFRRRGEETAHVRARPREVFDVSGAGDTALAALGLALSVGSTLHDAGALAVLASGVAVGKPGTAAVTPEELIEAELAQHVAPAHARIATPERMAAEVAKWKGRGLRVGFTNGCFDILHRGHVAYLAQARSWCDRLIVGLNSDASVRALKGEGRPVNDLEGRALVLGSLESVDLVVPFDAPTPEALIRAARPDVLIKGSDYAVDQVVGGEFVRSYGGEVRLADFVDGHSTTEAIARMKRA